MNNPSREELSQIEASIKDLDLDYMRGLVSEEEYNRKITELRGKLEQAGGTSAGLPSAPVTTEALKNAELKPVPSTDKQAMTDPVSAVRNTIHAMRRISIERIAQEAGVNTINVAKILSDLLDGRELSGRVDHDAGDFILGTGTGPAPKTVHGCPYCRTDLDRVAVKGETITCNVCKESFIVS
ncbi:MAG: hypothetical protein ACXADL_10150 [Candidatus Thorarchaeota archaeon]|jgi:hypothetical protein